MPSFNRNGTEISYDIFGTGPVILLSHGFSLTKSMWERQVQYLQDKYCVIVWDMRGHGESSYPQELSEYSEELAVEDMYCLLDIAGNGPAIVGGLSLGGYLSLSFYAAHPESCRALMLFDTGPGYRKDDARAEWNARARSRGDRLEREGLAQIEYPAKHRNASGLALAARGLLTQQDDRVMQVLPHISVPTLVLVGENDKPFLGAAKYMAKKIPQASKAIIPGAGHVANLDQPAAFNAAVGDFLSAL